MGLLEEAIKYIVKEGLIKGAEALGKRSDRISERENYKNDAIYFYCPACGKGLHCIIKDNTKYSCPGCSKEFTDEFLKNAALYYHGVIEKVISLNCPECSCHVTVTPARGELYICPECKKPLSFEMLYSHIR